MNEDRAKRPARDEGPWLGEGQGGLLEVGLLEGLVMWEALKNAPISILGNRLDTEAGNVGEDHIWVTNDNKVNVEF